MLQNMTYTHPQTCHTYMNCHLKYLYRLIPFSDDWIVLTGKKMKLEGREKKINYTKGSCVYKVQNFTIIPFIFVIVV